MKRKKLTAAEREARGEASFVKHRVARDLSRKQHLADTLAALDRTATICAAASARKRAMQVALTDRAARRKDRLEKRRKLWAQYQDWRAACPMTQWES